MKNLQPSLRQQVQFFILHSLLFYTILTSSLLIYDIYDVPSTHFIMT